MTRRNPTLLAAALAAGLMLATSAPAAPRALKVTGLWRIDQARTEPILDRSHARLNFGADGKLTGHDSCNTLSASYTLKGIDIKIGPVATTRKVCPTLQMEQEDRILQALEAAATAKLRSDGLLELRDSDGRGVLRGTRFGKAD